MFLDPSMESIISKLAQDDVGKRQLMISVFTECKRVLKDAGILAFTFHHSNPKAWWVILEALRKSHLFVVDYFPVKSEYKVNPHVRGKAADTDLVIICRKIIGIPRLRPSLSLMAPLGMTTLDNGE